jgi:hypothetical protein
MNACSTLRWAEVEKAKMPAFSGAIVIELNGAQNAKSGWR